MPDLPLPPFVSYLTEEGRGGRVLRGALLIGTVFAWTCEHDHDSRFGAQSCAHQARGQAVAAGLLPESGPVSWVD